MGWGEAVGKIFDWIPGRKEHIRNRIEKLKREYNEITKLPCTPANAKRLDRISFELSALQKKAANG